jgi:hypothetical protein
MSDLQNTMLTREQIIRNSDSGIVKNRVTVPEWGGDVYIKTMTAGERGEFEAIVSKDENRSVVRQVLLALTICDEIGNLIFAISDINELSKKSVSAIDRLFDVANKINKITTQEQVEVEKN